MFRQILLHQLPNILLSLSSPRLRNLLIELEHVKKSYPNAIRPAIDDVSLIVAKQSFVALLGASGSGKTTVLKTINRLIHPDQGEIRINGISVDAIDASLLRTGVGYVFQGSGLFPHLSVAENIGITPRLLGWLPTKIAARTSELLKMVALPLDFAGRLPNQLSGGQQQRVAIARALAATPPIVLMDEPFGALDPITRDALSSEYRKLHLQLQLTTMMVTHDMQEALLLADRIIVMQSGKVIADFLPDQALSQTHPDVVAMMAVPLQQAKKVQAILTGKRYE